MYIDCIKYIDCINRLLRIDEVSNFLRENKKENFLT